MSSSASPVAVSSEIFDTADPQRATEIIDSRWTSHRPVRLPAADGFHYRLERHSAGPLTVSLGRYEGSVRATHDKVDHLAVIALRAGQAEFTVGDEQLRLGPGDVAIFYRVDAELHAAWSDVTGVFVDIAPDEVDRIASEVFGLRRGDLRIQSMSPVSETQAQFWRDVSGFALRTLEANESALADPEVLSAIVRMLVVGALATFPTNARIAGRADPAALRRAVEFIESHAHEPLTVAQVAEAAGLGIRALQESFRRYHDETPMGYLRGIRLERAHRDLIDGDSTQGVTVAGIAAKWGFHHGGHFADLYRQRYGTSPRRTLAR